jgi:uncharacterized protein YbjT (DUF2867 family)
MILVTGATGNVGSQVVEQLSSTGAPVRAFVRDPEKAANVWETSVEIAEGDFQRPETLAAALEGVDRLFLLMGTAENQVELENDVIDAAVRAGVRRVVKLSIYGAEIGSPVPFRDWHGRIEARLEGAGLAYTHLRPTFFMQNAAYMLAPDGVFYVPSGAGRIGWVDVRDVAAVAVRALTEDGHEGKAYDITGPEVAVVRGSGRANLRGHGSKYPVPRRATGGGAAGHALLGYAGVAGGRKPRAARRRPRGRPGRDHGHGGDRGEG